MSDLGRLLMVAGGGLFLVGLLLFFGSRWGLGSLPGDIVVRRDNFTLFIPLGTMILLSILLTAVLNLVGRLFR